LPRARSYRLQVTIVAALADAGHDVTRLMEASYAELIESAKKAVASKPDALVVVGGDGMVNLGTNLVAGTTVPLGIVPSGTGNDMARSLGAAAATGAHRRRRAGQPVRRRPALVRLYDLSRLRRGRQ
ncbi:MAG: acylglycerol kinase family protein, partial [Actinomycetota bacterium]